MNHTTRKHPRTMREAFGMSPEDAIAIEVYRAPLPRRILYWWIKHGWVIIFIGLVAALIYGA